MIPLLVASSLVKVIVLGVLIAVPLIVNVSAASFPNMVFPSTVKLSCTLKESVM